MSLGDLDEWVTCLSVLKSVASIYESPNWEAYVAIEDSIRTTFDLARGALASIRARLRKFDILSFSYDTGYEADDGLCPRPPETLVMLHLAKASRIPSVPRTNLVSPLEGRGQRKGRMTRPAVAS